MLSPETMHANWLYALERVATINSSSTMARVGPWLLLDTGEPAFAAPNSATPIGEASASDIDSAVAWFEERSSPFHFALRSDRDSGLCNALQAKGYAMATPIRALSLDRPRPPAYDGPLSIREVLDSADIGTYGKVNWPPDQRRTGVAIAETAARLGFCLLLGELEGRPVACSMAVVSDGLVGVYNVGVEEAYRRRGFGAAMTWAAVAAGLDRGGRSAWLGASEMGYSLYRRMGFEDRFDYLSLERPGA